MRFDYQGQYYKTACTIIKSFSCIMKLKVFIIFDFRLSIQTLCDFFDLKRQRKMQYFSYFIH